MDYQKYYILVRNKMMQGKLDVDSRFPRPFEFYPSILQVAIMQRDDRLIDYLLRHNADANMAIKWSEADAVDMKEKIDIRNKYGKRPLDLAIKIRNHELIKKLITSGAYVAHQDKCHNILNAVTEEGNYQMTEWLIHLGFNIDYKSIVTGESPLHTAVRLNRRDIAELLIRKRADINAKTISHALFDPDTDSNGTEGLTPLYLATIDKNQDMVRVLLKNGAVYDDSVITLARSNRFFEFIKIVAAISDDKITLSSKGAEFIWAVEEGEFVVAGILINRRSSWSSSLSPDFIRKYFEFVEYLVENGANVNEIQHLYTTPLHLAISGKYNQAAKYLIDKGAKLYLTNDHVDTLRLAIDKNNHEIIEYIMRNASDTNEHFVFRASLQWAMERNNFQVAKYLIDKCTNVNFVYGKETPLHRAILNDNLELVKYLVEKGAKVNIIIDGEIPLIISIHLSRNEIAKYLIDNGADVDFNYNGITPLLFAIAKNNIDVAEYLIDHGSDLSALVNMNGCFGVERFFGWSRSDVSSHNFSNGRSALTLAIDLGRSEIAKYLIPRGVDLKTTENKAALHLAINNADTEVAKLLIDKGADVNYIYKDTKFINFNGPTSIGVTPLILAICKRNDQVVKYLLDKAVDMNSICNDGELFVLAALYDNEELIEFYINKGFNINTVVSFQNTKLGTVIYNNSRREVKGSDIFAILKGATALDAAIQAGNDRLFDLLINAGAVISKSVLHKNPLRFAVRNNYCHVVEYLVQNGADVNSVEDNKSLLVEAVYCKHPEVVELLLKNKADVNLQTKSRVTALDVAINDKNYLMMAMLLEFGAVSIRHNVTDKPILYLAIENRSYHHAIAIIKRGANVNVVYKNKTLLHIALTKGNTDVINYLLAAGFDVNYQDEDKKTAVNYECPRIYHQYYDDEFDSTEEVSCIKDVKEHIVKMITADFYVCKQNRLAVDNDFKQLRADCTKEVDLMKQTFVIPRIKITYYDLLHGLNHKLAERFKFVFRSDENKTISIVDNIRSLFLQYRGIVYFRAKSIFIMARSLVQVEDLIMDIFDGVLEVDVVPAITKYLSVEDINIIRRYL